MAGDHKCPVCDSTFTRPQHVARHMRSHTGDRPYKCSHCGDQFARSDLLSRHVNKCHASAKPPTTTQPASRRRGHAQPGSSTTGVRGPAPPLIPPPGSRKICDACSISRTPAQCDSGFPCGKCMQRNSECLYTKASNSRRPIPITAPELFAPPTTVPSMAPPRGSTDGLYPPNASAFTFSVPLYANALDSSSAAPGPSYSYDQSGNQGSQLGAISAFTTDHPAAHTATHQSALNLPYAYPHAGSGANADVRNSNINGVHHPASLSSKNVLYNAYLDSAFPPPPGANYLYGDSNNTHNGGSNAAMSSLLPEGLPNVGLGQQHAHAHQRHEQQQQQHMPPSLPVHTQIDYALFSRNRQQQQQQQQESQPQRHSSGENSPTPPQLGGQQQQGQVPQSSNVTTTSNTTTKNHKTTTEPGVFSAFGLMSLDDPNISAEMAREQSFFAPGALPGNLTLLPAQPNLSTGLTPGSGRDNAAGNSASGGSRLGLGPVTASLLMPNLGLGGGGGGPGGNGTGLGSFGEAFGTGLTPGREMNAAELKDFWRTFMRSPGEKTPGTGGLSDGGVAENKDTGTISDGSRRSSQHRPLSKIASLPEIKTPGGGGGGGALGHFAAYNQYNNNNSNNNASRDLNATAMTRQSFSANEDLRSYEQAVLARQAPTLTLPKQRAGSLGSTVAKDIRRNQLTPPQLDSNASSPASTSSVTSSSHYHYQQDRTLNDGTAVHAQQHQILNNLGSNENSNNNTHTGSLAARRLSRTDRPTFKRIASFTHVPVESNKSAKMSHHAREDRDDDPEWADGVDKVSYHQQQQPPLSSQTADQSPHGHARSPSAEHPPGYQTQHQGRRLSAPSMAGRGKPSMFS